MSGVDAEEVVECVVLVVGDGQGVVRNECLVGEVGLDEREPARIIGERAGDAERVAVNASYHVGEGVGVFLKTGVVGDDRHRACVLASRWTLLEDSRRSTETLDTSTEGREAILDSRV
eukprot:5083935-Prymnesium_polylepis.1